MEAESEMRFHSDALRLLVCDRCVLITQKENTRTHAGLIERCTGPLRALEEGTSLDTLRLKER